MRFLRLGASGLRGEVGTALTYQLAIRYASALGSRIDGASVGIGMDTRISSPMLKAACLSALLSCGCRVIDFGVCPSAVLHYGVRKMGLSGGILIGAAHHPAGWNALSAISGSGANLNETQTQEMLDIYHSGVFRMVPWEKLGHVEPVPPQIVNSYLDDLCSIVDLDAIRKKNYCAVVDFCCGSGSVIFKQFAKRTGLNLIPINENPSGVLPHDPEPRPRSAVQVKSLIAPLHADAGFVFSSDVGRVAIVTDSGETLSEEYTFPIAADNVLSKMPERSPVVTNWCTTRTLDEIVARHNGVLIKGMTGETFTVDRMCETGAVIAGDGSGSVVVPQTGVLAFDGFAAMLLTLESMALRGENCSQIAADLPRLHIVKRSLPCRSVNAYSAMRSIRDLFPDAACTENDGLRFDWPEGWIHIRASKTEPILRMILEWKDREQALAKAQRVRACLERLVQ